MGPQFTNEGIQIYFLLKVAVIPGHFQKIPLDEFLPSIKPDE
jgi:hypothetical protein